MSVVSSRSSKSSSRCSRSTMDEASRFGDALEDFSDRMSVASTRCSISSSRCSISTADEASRFGDALEDFADRMSVASTRCSISTADEASRFGDALEDFGASLKSRLSTSKQLQLKGPSHDWPWAPDYEELLRTPRKKNWESTSRKENCDSSRASSRSSRSRTSRSVKKTPRPSPLSSPQAVKSSNAQDEVDLNSRARRVLEEVREIQANVLVNSPLKDGDKKSPCGKPRLKDWCIEKGFQCFNRGHQTPHKHHKHHKHHKDETEYNGPRRSSLKDPPVKQHNQDYGQNRDALEVWKHHQPKQPHKGDLEVLPAQPAEPRQVYLL